jgi:hypothetical protein
MPRTSRAYGWLRAIAAQLLLLQLRVKSRGNRRLRPALPAARRHIISKEAKAIFRFRCTIAYMPALPYAWARFEARVCVCGCVWGRVYGRGRVCSMFSLVEEDMRIPKCCSYVAVCC